MGREVRRVPKDWSHPKNEQGHYRPQHDQDYESACEEWLNGLQEWESGRNPSREKYGIRYFWNWNGPPPNRDYYRDVRWADEERTHYQMYENVSEGTPISPVMESPEQLARWLADNKANSGAGMTATYEQWLRVCRGGYAPSLVIGGGRVMSGVEGFEELRAEEK